MKRNSLVLNPLALTVLAASLATAGAATAQSLDSIIVRPTSGSEMTFACNNLFNPRPIDVEALLNINDRTQTQSLSNKLVDAMGEACRAGYPTIVVERGKSGGSLVWYPVGGSRYASSAAYVAPAYAGPVYVEPAYAQPVYAQPVYVDPDDIEPVYEDEYFIEQ